MKLSITHTKNNTYLYMVKAYRNKNGKSTSKIIEKLGTLEEVTNKAKGQDPIQWAKEYIAQKTQAEKEQISDVVSKFSQTKILESDSQNLFNCGYLFLQDIYYKLNLNKICKKISQKYKFEYNLDSILSRLIYARILQPSSKLSSYDFSKELLEQPSFELQHIYRALEVIAKETEFIESSVYESSLKLVNRNTKILYYDCTNYFFETEEASGIKQYGLSKEHRPSPIVQMGLLMDGNGFPLAFCINPGNTNEQVTLKPLEERIIKDFNLSKFVVCTDAGLSSTKNRLFNNIQNRSFVVTQSLKKIKGHLKEWALSPEDWHKLNSSKKINLEKIDHSSDNQETYYKERWINENGIEQRLIVSYSPKYAAYQKSIRATQIMRAQALINHPSSISKNRTNDPKRFISSSHITKDGEVAENRKISLNNQVIANEEMFDGFYAVCTTLKDDISEIIKVNKRRWEIEESFRILKSEFKARPVYLKNDDRIKAHFTICFLSLLIYRILENKLENKFSASQIIKTIKQMNLLQIQGVGYLPAYTRTNITDMLHNIFQFRTDTEIVTKASLKKIFKISKIK